MAKNATKTSLDYTNAITNSHNEEAKALNIVDVSSLVPARYGKIELEYDSPGCISKVKYLSNGTYQETRIVCSADTLGSAHKTTVNFMGKTPAMLAGKSFVVHDALGATAVWFNVDNSNTEPSVPATYRSIEVKLMSNDTASAMASKTTQKLNADTLFISMYSLHYSIISAANTGVRPNSYNIDANLSLKNTAGTDSQSLNNKVWYINSANDIEEYYVWYNVSGAGSDPLIAGKIGVMVAVTTGASGSVVAQQTKIALEATDKFTVSINKDSLLIVNNLVGQSTYPEEGNSNFVIFVEKNGENRDLIVTLVLGYNSNGELTSVERL